MGGVWILNIIKSLFNRKKEKYLDPSLNLDCTEFEVNNWIISEFVIQELIPIVGVKPYPINELLLMVAAVCRLKPTHVFEWGTHIGKSARVFYETAHSFGIRTEIHSIDLPDEIDHVEHPKSMRGEYVKDIKEVKLYQGDGIEKSLEVIKNMPGDIKPLFFLDGDHGYESVKRELENIMIHVQDANILVHDTFYQSPESGYNIGPYRAIVETLSSISNKYLTISIGTGLPGMTLLYQL